jgi:hypothetical protein
MRFVLPEKFFQGSSGLVRLDETSLVTVFDSHFNCVYTDV